jgi:hypothetical protein
MIVVTDIVSSVGMKAHALGRPLKLDKDSYDLKGRRVLPDSRAIEDAGRTRQSQAPP